VVNSVNDISLTSWAPTRERFYCSRLLFACWSDSDGNTHTYVAIFCVCSCILGSGGGVSGWPYISG